MEAPPADQALLIEPGLPTGLPSPPAYLEVGTAAAMGSTALEQFLVHVQADPALRWQVIACWPVTLSLILEASTPMDLASRYGLIPSGCRNSSCNSSPGVMGHRRFLAGISGSRRFRQHPGRQQT